MKAIIAACIVEAVLLILIKLLTGHIAFPFLVEITALSVAVCLYQAGKLYTKCEIN